MRIVSWNMNKRKSGCWEWLLDQHSPDYVMAQEASPLPEGLDATVRTTTKKSNRTVFYSKNQSHEKIKMEYDEGMGILVTRYSEIYFINIYANLDFTPVDPPLLGYIAKFVSHVRRRYGAENIIIAGDFNDWHQRLHRRFLNLDLKEAFCEQYGRPVKSFPSKRPLLPLDRVYFRGLTLRHAQLLHGEPWESLSDHCALYAEFELPGELNAAGGLK
mgnify:CR=1 FL=1